MALRSGYHNLPRRGDGAIPQPRRMEGAELTNSNQDLTQENKQGAKGQNNFSLQLTQALPELCLQFAPESFQFRRFFLLQFGHLTGWQV